MQQPVRRRSSGIGPGGKAAVPTNMAVAKDAAMAFMDADVDGDNSLNLEEFKHMVSPSCILTVEQIEDLFDAADIDGDGKLSLNEYLMWLLNYTTINQGSGLEKLFHKHDRDGTGQLDAAEFGRVLGEMGFGNHAHHIFMELDQDGSGTISYDELDKKLKAAAVKSGGTVVSRHCKRFLTTLIYHNGKLTGGDADAREHVDTSRWRLVGTDVNSLRVELANYLLRHSMRISDLFHLVTAKHIGAEKKTTKITRALFTEIMAALGFEGEESVLDDVFRRVDFDKSGTLDIEELFAWMNGTAGRRQAAAQLTLLKEREGETTLETIDWSPSELHRQLQLMLISNSLSPVDLLQSNDRDEQDGKLVFKEFLRMMKRLVHPCSPQEVDLWDSEIRPCVQETFRQIAGEDKVIDVIEFERWLNKGWSTVAKSRLGEDIMGAGDSAAVVPASQGTHVHPRASERSGLAQRPRLSDASFEAAVAPSNGVASTMETTARRGPRHPHVRQTSSVFHAEATLRGNAISWEVADYLSKICKFAEHPRLPREQWALLNGAKRELDMRKARAAGWGPVDSWDLP